MNSLFFLLLVVVPVAIVLVGHGIWVVVAWLLRGGRPRDDQRSYEPTLSDDRAATARYLEHLRACELIDPVTHGKLMRVIAEDVHPMPVYLHEQSEVPGPGMYPDGAAKVDEEPSESPVIEMPAPIAAPPSAPSQRRKDVRAISESLFAPEEPEQIPAEPRRPFSEVLLASMAERNIRWGELVGGLLIVCCSTALVISLWSRIEAIPVLKFLIFTAVTAALFGVGLFVHHRWNLPTTGHALLIISCLLVPLNLLAFAALSRPGPAAGGWTLAVELLAVALFGWLTLLAARIIMSDAAILLTCGVVGLSASSLIIRLLSPLSDNGLIGAALLPIALYVIVMAMSLWQPSRLWSLSASRARQLTLQLGVQTFACLAPLGLVFYESGHVAAAIHLLSPVICVAAGPALVVGIFLSRRLEQTAPPQVRLTATSIALVAAAVALLGVGLAWPMPSRLMPALLANAAATVAISWLVRHPVAHGTAAGWFAAAWVLAVHLATGGVSWHASDPSALMTALLSARTGQALVGPAIACALIAGWLDQRQRHVLSVGYVISALAFSVVSLGLVTWRGFGVPGDAEHITWVYCVYGVIALSLAGRLTLSWATWIGCLLLQAAIAQALACAWPLRLLAWPTALLTGASACVAAVVTLRAVRVREEVAALYVTPLARFAVAVSLLAVVWMVTGMSSGSLGAFSARMAWLSVLGIALAIANRWPIVFAGSQIALVAAACIGMHRYLQGSAWYQALASPPREPWVWQAYLLVISVFCLVWAMARVAVNLSRSTASVNDHADHPSPDKREGWLGVMRALLDPSFPATDRWLTVAVLLTLAVLSFRYVLPATAVEHHWVSPTASQGHTHAGGIAAWIILLAVITTLLVHLWEGFRLSASVGVVVAAACATVLIAGRFESRQMVVAAWRWLSASALLAASAALWTRGYWLERVKRLAHMRPARETAHWSTIRLCLFVLFALPAVVLTATFAVSLGYGKPIGSPGTSDVWLRISLLGPSVLVVLSLICYGVSEQRPRYVVGASVLACAVVTATELCLVGRAGRGGSLALIAWLVQLNVIVFAGVPLLWHAARNLIAPQGDAPPYPKDPLIIGRAAIGVMLLLAAAAVWVQPRFIPAAVAASGTLWAFLAVLLVEWALLTLCAPTARTQQGHRESVWALFGAMLIGCALARFDTGNWLCYHALTIGFLAAGALRLCAGHRRVGRLLGAGWRETFDAASVEAGDSLTRIDHELTCTHCNYNLRGLAPSGRCPECGLAIAESLVGATDRLTPRWAGQLAQARAHAVGAVLTCAGLSAIFALRGVRHDPQRPWWSAAALAALSLLYMVLAGWAPRRGLAYLGGVAICLAASIWWTTLHWSKAIGVSEPDLCNLVNVNGVSLVLAGIAWLFIERRISPRRSAAESTAPWPAFHHVALAVSIAAAVLLAGAALCGAAFGRSFIGAATLGWLAWAAAVTLLIASSRLEPTFRSFQAGLYALGLAAIARIIVHFGLTSHSLTCTISMGLAAYALITTLLWRRSARPVGDVPSQAGPPTWLMVANGGIALASVVLAVLVSLRHPEGTWRALIVASPLLCALAAILAADGIRQATLRTCAAALLTAGAVLLPWAWVTPDATAATLHRAVGLLAAVAMMTVASAGAMSRITPGGSWSTAMARCVVGSGAVAGAALLYCCGYEVVALVKDRPVPLAGPAIAAMIAALVVMIVCCILFATRDRLDPLRLDSRLKEGYVYLAEALAAALVLHVRATMPWLFTGFITQYWPMLIVVLAFAAVTAEEVCQRFGSRVLARPFGRTGVFLPALALLELLLASSQVHYSIVLLTTGALYGVLAALRRSIILGALAGVLLNSSLWYLLHHAPGLGISRHPQLWFIPPALAVLVAGHLNRARLTEQQRQVLHYACLLAVYLSSTADVFLIGVAQAPWLPLVLAGLSIVGVLVGFVSRVRSFLMLGTGFLCLSLMTMIWHAATNLGWTWVWYVAGIVLGASIITVFALFEKKRNEMNAWLEQLKH
ncbi:MAG: hypothetical protein JXQ73_07920 [Phycisphaerae bacterium]|nr:hypothetical protein [Phycisphaerae bacterium]